MCFFHGRIAPPQCSVYMDVPFIPSSAESPSRCILTFSIERDQHGNELTGQKIPSSYCQVVVVVGVAVLRMVHIAKRVEAGRLVSSSSEYRYSMTVYRVYMLPHQKKNKICIYRLLGNEWNSKRREREREQAISLALLSPSSHQTIIHSPPNQIHHVVFAI